MSNNENLLEPSLTRKLLLQHHPNQRITNDAVNAANELLRLFIIEARHRAAVEAECEQEGEDGVGTRRRKYGEDTMGPNESDGEDGDSQISDELSPNHPNSQKLVTIRAEHITKIAAELLMDFS
mmetsp:Transcript_25573/g.46318  ORF Transcript_25573/g.46318 Transcript_25573/m.46318 type:complete len:124 (-) Transcript_25573:87-458(-)|eukprot:CAMPEP_0198284974 /NCGR_PEP_ID=MMETSP1449-20131203/4316_1 /TAXON_ID=420275 /ORGANISM="Attheya septentrionalis, Strain CCMP2084" /LENGTH=123 /DNA_ID=CAMNT_0043982199 /DNA_START=110 /DNA_END=481 /DNA_ORIENTATION=-